MRLIPHANKIFFLFFLVCLADAKQSLPKGEQVLDLTAPPLSEHRSMGVPGTSSGGTSDGRSFGPPLYDLPVAVRIERIEIRHGSSGALLRVWMEVVNVGALRFQLPSCVDEFKAHGSPGMDRRTFAFRLEFSGHNVAVPDMTTAAVTFAAASMPDCSMSLAPGSRIQVVLENPMPISTSESATKTNEIKLRVVCNEFQLEDSRFQVSKQSREIQSNSVILAEPN